MKKEAEILLMSYQNQFHDDTDKYIARYEEQKIDSGLFYYLSESTFARYIGHIDTLFDVDMISYEDWKRYYENASKYVQDCQRKVRKADLEPSDPSEEV